MKKAIAILILAALLTGCEQTVEPTAETVKTTPTTSTSAIITEKEKAPAVTTKATSRAVSTTPSATMPTATITTTARTTTTTAPVSAATAAVSATETESRTTTRLTTNEPVSARQEPVVATTTTRATTTAKATTTAESRTTTTAKPTATTTTKITVPKPPIISKVTTTVIKNGITYVEVPDVTCLATMIENLEETDTPPYYNIQIGRSLKHNGTDYGKAIAVYNWVTRNGWGSCVYHALETYYVCQGIDLECAYAFCTDNGWYGHTYNAVKVEGEWYVLDTQGHTFLDNTCHLCKRLFDGNDQDLSPYDEWIWYPYDQYGEYRNWTVEPAE